MQWKYVEEINKYFLIEFFSLQYTFFNKCDPLKLFIKKVRSLKLYKSLAKRSLYLQESILNSIEGFVILKNL